MSNNPELITTLLEAFKDERNKVKQLERQIQDNALNTSSGQILQDSFCNKKTVVIGQFNKIQREGNLILAWLSSNETPVVGYTGMDTDIHRDKGCNVYHLDYDFSTISEKE